MGIAPSSTTVLPWLPKSLGPNKTLYGLVPAQKSIIAITPNGKMRTVVGGITGRKLTGTHDGRLYVSEPGTHR